MQGGMAKKLIEPAIWIVFAAIAYYFSFEFDREIQIYKFGAAGWPRAILILIVIAAICQAIASLRQAPGEAEAEEAEDKEEAGLPGIRVAAIILLPLLYAGFIEQMGFYVLTPLFILAFLLLAGEKRVKMLLGVTVGIYVLLVFLFGRVLYINLPVGNWQPFYDFSNWLLVLIR